MSVPPLLLPGSCFNGSHFQLWITRIESSYRPLTVTLVPAAWAGRSEGRNSVFSRVLLLVPRRHPLQNAR